MTSEEMFSLRDTNNQTQSDKAYKGGIVNHFEASSGSAFNKLENFTRFVPRQSLALFLAKNELFQRILNVHGSIVECGVFMGGGLFTWAQLSSIYEPVNHNRRVIGFDSFEGFPSLSGKDLTDSEKSQISHKVIGGYSFCGEDELKEAIDLYDLNRAIGHIGKVELVKGNATQTIPEYLVRNPHTVISLLYLDFDIFEPTIVALKAFLPRMPKGAVIAFDELNQAQWPGETLAVVEEIGLRNLAIRRFPYSPALSYAVID